MNDGKPRVSPWARAAEASAAKDQARENIAKAIDETLPNNAALASAAQEVEACVAMAMHRHGIQATSMNRVAVCATYIAACEMTSTTHSRLAWTKKNNHAPPASWSDLALDAIRGLTDTTLKGAREAMDEAAKRHDGTAA